MKSITTPSRYDKIIADDDEKVIYFGSKSCPHCHMIEPTIERLRRDHPERRFYHVEYTDSTLRPIFSTARVTTLPTLFAVHKGKITRFDHGTNRADELERFLDAHPAKENERL